MCNIVALSLKREIKIYIHVAKFEIDLTVLVTFYLLTIFFLPQSKSYHYTFIHFKFSESISFSER